MDPITFHGEAFSEYFCTNLLWNDPQLGKEIKPRTGAVDLFTPSGAARATSGLATGQVRENCHGA
jgi:hypothetical protein